MTSLPAVVETTPVSNDLATDVVIDRFLARVAALTPAQWGTLDAIGQRAGAADPISRWRQLRRHLGVVGPTALRDALAAVGMVGGYVLDAAFEIEHALSFGLLGPAARRAKWRQLSERLRVDEEGRRTRQAPPDEPPLASRVRWETARLFELAKASPGPHGTFDALRCLLLGMMALRLRATARPAAFAEMYELVEPVIPAASLERA